MTGAPLELLAPALPAAPRLDYLRALLLEGTPAQEAWERWRRAEPSLVDALKAEPGDALAATLPLLDAASRRDGLALTSDEATRVRAARLRERLRGEAYAAILARVLDALAATGIETLVLGGRPLGERLHGDASLHHSGAIDLLVHGGCRDRAVTALRAVGLASAGRIGSAAWTRSLLRDESGLHATVAEIAIPHPRYCLDEDEVWSNAIEWPVDGIRAPVRGPALGDQLTLLALRGAWTGPSRSLVAMVDVVLLARAAKGDDWRAVARAASRGHFALPLAAVVRFLADNFDGTIPANLARDLERQAAEAAAVDEELALAISAAACGYRLRPLLSAAHAARRPAALLRFLAVPSAQTMEWESGSRPSSPLAVARLRRLARGATLARAANRSPTGPEQSRDDASRETVDATRSRPGS